MKLRVNVNILFLHTNPKKIFNLQSTSTFSAKYENFLSLALSQAMCSSVVMVMVLYNLVAYGTAKLQAFKLSSQKRCSLEPIMFVAARRILAGQVPIPLVSVFSPDFEGS